MVKKGIAIILIFVLLISSAACREKADPGNADITSISTSEEQQKAEEPASEQEGTKPDGSDGEGTAKEEDGTVDNFVFPEEGTRPFAVMIDNQGSAVLPQGGLHMAQVVYEIIVEGGITRYMPVFWNVDPEMIGPVRSSRHYFLDYAMEHDAIYVHFGQSPQALKDLQSYKINNINGIYVAGVFWDLTKDKGNWQDSYTSMEKAKEYANKVGYRTETDKKHVFTYNRKDAELQSAEKAEKVSITYSDGYISRYEYDATTKTYMRFRNGKPHMERITGEQLAVKNIIIQVVKNQRIKGDKEDRQELFNVGSGNGWYITNGKVIKIKWSKASRPEPTQYTDEAGNPIALNPGQTWVQIAPSADRVVIE